MFEQMMKGPWKMGACCLPSVAEAEGWVEEAGVFQLGHVFIQEG